MNAKSKNKVKKIEKGLFEKAKDLFDKADDFMEEKAKKVRKSKAFGTATSTLKEVESFVEGAVDEFGKSETKKKIDKALVKVEKKAEKTFKDAKEFGKTLASETENRLDNIAENLKSKPLPEKSQPKAAVSKPMAAKEKPKAAKAPAKTAKVAKAAPKAAAKAKPKAAEKPAKTAKK
jgi:colicin import membrane protein